MNEDKLTCGRVRAAIGLAPADPGTDRGAVTEAEIAAHLAACPSCRAYAEADAALRHSLRESAETPPDGLTASLLTAARARFAARRLAALRRAAVGLAACFVLFAVLGTVLVVPLTRRPNENETAGLPLSAADKAAVLSSEPDGEAQNVKTEVQEEYNIDEEAGLVPPGASDPNTAVANGEAVPTVADLPEKSDAHAKNAEASVTEAADLFPTDQKAASPAVDETAAARAGSGPLRTVLLILTALLALASLSAMILTLTAIRRARTLSGAAGPIKNLSGVQNS